MVSVEIANIIWKAIKKNFTTKQFLFKTLSFNNGEYECFLYDIVTCSLVTIFMADYSFKKAIN